MNELNQYILSLEHKEDVSAFDLVKKIHDTADYYMEKDMNRWLVCKKGCGHCCALTVQLAGIEAAYISEMTGKTLNKMAQNNEHIDMNPGNCPMFDSNSSSCTIYPYRPLACRLFGAFDDPKLCEDPGTSHYIHSTQSQPFLGAAYSVLTDNSGAVGLAALADIRDWFNGKK